MVSLLYTACYFGYRDVVKHLMSAGADETITDDYADTPAQLAEKAGNTHVLKNLER